MGLKTHSGFPEQPLRAVQAPQPSQSQVRGLGLGPDRPSYPGLGTDCTAKIAGTLLVSAVPEPTTCSCLLLPLSPAYSCPLVGLTKSLKSWGYYNGLQLLHVYCRVPLPEGSRFLSNSPGKDCLSSLALRVYEPEVKGASNSNTPRLMPSGTWSSLRLSQGAAALPPPPRTSAR